MDFFFFCFNEVTDECKTIKKNFLEILWPPTQTQHLVQWILFYTKAKEKVNFKLVLCLKTTDLGLREKWKYDFLFCSLQEHQWRDWFPAATRPLPKRPADIRQFIPRPAKGGAEGGSNKVLSTLIIQQTHLIATWWLSFNLIQCQRCPSHTHHHPPTPHPLPSLLTSWTTNPHHWHY